MQDENDDRDRQRRHDQANTESGESRMRRIAYSEIAALFNQWGVDINDSRSRQSFADLLQHARERYRRQDDINRAVEYALEMRNRADEIRDALDYIRREKRSKEMIQAENKKGFFSGMWQLVFAAIAATVSALLTYISTHKGP